MDDICGAMVQMNDKGIITAWNDSAENILGYTADEVLGTDGIQKIFINNEKDNILNVVETGEVYYSFDSHVLNKAGEVQPVALVTSPLTDSAGSISGITVLISNILLL
ncbi:putative PAS/PAC sensor protein [Denitrovibrio acetiphilus DSM 12809]|uniref:Putative PAS/PAC sensor protein n=1 Tax=Denitrovibrio acetiphilus (strain DSM 12809 / NBRC 114555 / N2460) TaxID=522772 RepID=D4H357_DENA2|nr:PAS sensor domain-containing protein [Denitrovibrio acetiphilus]ADD69080.1 putative PAS/PAC sensor protein [Denitrovibrio acetiphilus DSM 12809]